MKDIIKKLGISLGIVIALAAVIGILWIGIKVIAWIVVVLLALIAIFAAYLWICDTWTKKNDKDY